MSWKLKISKNSEKSLIFPSSSTLEFESGKMSEPQTTYHRPQTKMAGSSNLPGAINFSTSPRSSLSQS